MDPTDIKDIETDIQKCKAAIRKLKAESVNYVSFLPSGKLEVLDKEALAAINAEAARLAALVEHNGDVLRRLVAALEGFDSIKAVRERAGKVRETISKSHTIYRLDLAAHLKSHTELGRPVDLDSDPVALKLKATRDEALSTNGPELERLEKISEKARAIVAEAKLSGLPDALEGDQYRQAITWEDTAVLRGSGGDVGRGRAGPK